MFTNALFAPPVAGTDPQLPYQFSERVIGAVNVAMAAGRPLLVTGEPGSGKSTLAKAVADVTGRAYVEHVFTSRSLLADLTAGLDAVRRLADAQLQQLLPEWAYLTPGALWWAFDPGSAATRGHPEEAAALDDAQRRTLAPVADLRTPKGASPGPAVVLLDEIDKADPDLPNDLLVPLDRNAFHLPDGRTVQAAHDVFVVITSNGERRLPPAFLRRCVHLEMEIGDPDFFVTVACAHFGGADRELYRDVAASLMQQRAAARRASRREPSTAEYLDTVKACLRLGERPSSERWATIERAALTKERRPRTRPAPERTP